jgi:hypothetical protein
MIPLELPKTRVATQMPSTSQVETDSKRTSVTPTQWRNVTMRLPSHAKHFQHSINAATSVSTRMAMQDIRNRIFAATYKEACDIDPYGQMIFLEGIQRNNPTNYLLIEQRMRGETDIRAWNQHTHFPPIQDPITHIPIVKYPRWLQGIPRQHEMVKRVPNPDVGPRHHRYMMATVQPTPSLISRLFGPIMADATVHETLQRDHEKTKMKGKKQIVRGQSQCQTRPRT